MIKVGKSTVKFHQVILAQPWTGNVNIFPVKNSLSSVIVVLGIKEAGFVCYTN